MKLAFPRNPWPVAITGFFIAAIIFIGTFIAWAVQQRDDLVSADYYEREVRFQTQLDSQNRSQAIATTSVVTFAPANQEIVITLPADHVTASGQIHFYRPSDARLDRDLPLALDAGGVQRVAARHMPQGLWKVHIKWTVAGQAYFLDQPVIVTAQTPGAGSL